MYFVVLTRQALKDAKKLKSAGLAEKAKRLIDVLEHDPFDVPPSFEALVGNLSGCYSRRISLQHRMVYTVDAEPVTLDGVHYEGIIKILHMWTHYEKL